MVVLLLQHRLESGDVLGQVFARVAQQFLVQAVGLGGLRAEEALGILGDFAETRPLLDPAQPLAKRLGPGMSVIATVDTDSGR